MRRISKTDFSELTAPEMATAKEALEVASNRMVVGYFLPVDVYHDLLSEIGRLKREAGEGDDD